MSRPFRFLQFSVAHHRSTMKVGTDAVLLGAWVNVTGATSLLDIGTGCGVIALMLAQRTTPEAVIDSVEPDPMSYREAVENVGQSPWPGKIAVHNLAIQKFHPGLTYDRIVSNPPYFINSLLPPSAVRGAARHTLTLSPVELLEAVVRLLKSTGIFGVILPTAEGEQFIDIARQHGLYCHRKLAFYTRENKPQERWLLEFQFIPSEPAVETLVLYQSANQWSDAYRTLTRAFYLP